MKTRAFTLAEVLITLGVIGIVIAMTLPTLVAKHRLKVLHTQFLKTYSELNNVAKRFESEYSMTVYEYSNIGGTPTDTLKKVMKYFVGNINGKQIGTDYDESTNGNLAFNNAIGYTPKNLAGVEQKTHPCDQSIIVQEIGGRYFSMDDSINTYSDPLYGPKICVDINGKKGPNIYGYDWFVFVFTKEGGVKPYIGNSLIAIAEEMENPESACSKDYPKATYTCAYFALQDKSPLGDGTYWRDFLK